MLGTIAVVLPPGRALVQRRPAAARGARRPDRRRVPQHRRSRASLADHVAELDRTTRRARRSLGCGWSRPTTPRGAALEAAIARDVLPLLADLPDADPAGPRRPSRPARPHGLDRLVAGTNAALEALRDLTRGVFPAQLARAGLGAGAAVAARPRRRRRPTLTVDGRRRRAGSPRGSRRPSTSAASRPRAEGWSPLDLSPDGRRAGAVAWTWSGTATSTSQSISDRVEAVGGSVERRRGHAAGDHPGGAGAGLSAGRCPRRRPRPLRAGPGRTPPWRRTPRRRSPTSSNWSSSYVDSSTTTGPSGRADSRRAASMPSMPGRLTSISTRSGRSSAAAASDSSPVVAEPTTTKPSVASTTAAIARRIGLLVVDDQDSDLGHGTPPRRHRPPGRVQVSGVGRTPAGGWPLRARPRHRSPRGRRGPPSPGGSTSDSVDQPELLEHRADVLLDRPLAHVEGLGDGRVAAAGRELAGAPRARAR